MICQLCKAKIPENSTCQDLYSQLSFYTLNHPDPIFFIHQYVVDAYAAQHADENSKPIKIAFALIGLYLFAEKNYTGKEVQLAHMQLAKEKREYPKFILPQKRGEVTVADVLNIKAGSDRDEMIKKWAKSVWQAFIDNRSQIINLLAEIKFNEKK